MFKPLVRYFINRKLKADDRRPSMVHGDLIMHAAVVAIYDEKEGFDHVYRYVKELRQRGLKTVDLYIYFPQKKAMQHFQGGMKDFLFDDSHFTLTGKY